MQTIILCGGKGTRLREETEYRPKPMVPIGNRPILWHIMKRYSAYGYEDFVLCLGYKAEHIREYFLKYHVNHSNLLVELGTRNVRRLDSDHGEHTWKVWLVDTGAETLTGGRVKAAERYVKGDTFMVTYGDGVADIDVCALVDFHRSHGRLATVTAVRPSSRYGELSFDGNRIARFKEKPNVQEGWINGGFFVFQREVFDLIREPLDTLEGGLLEKLTTLGELQAYRHPGFWQCMDTAREMIYLEDLWGRGQAPWKCWD